MNTIKLAFATICYLILGSILHYFFGNVGVAITIGILAIDATLCAKRARLF